MSIGDKWTIFFNTYTNDQGTFILKFSVTNLDNIKNQGKLCNYLATHQSNASRKMISKD